MTPTGPQTHWGVPQSRSLSSQKPLQSETPAPPLNIHSAIVAYISVYHNIGVVDCGRTRPTHLSLIPILLSSRSYIRTFHELQYL